MLEKFAHVDIPIGHMDDFKKHMEKLNKTAIKLNLPPVSFEESKPFMQKMQTCRIEHRHDSDRCYRDILFITVTVSGESPKLSGWTFKGVIQHTEVGNILRGTDNIPEKYRSTHNTCDYCQKLRHRKDTYLVQHDNGTWKQVGSNCLKDFLGHKSPEDIARYFSRLWSFLATCGEYNEEEIFSGERLSVVYSLYEFLNTAALSIANHGYIKTNEDYAVPTVYHTLQLLHDNSGSKHAALKVKKHKIDIEAVITWLESLENPSNDYLYNLSIIGKLGYVNKRTQGYAASIIPAYQRAQENLQKMDKARNTSQYIGQIKDRLNLTLTVKSVYYSEGYYGAVNIYTMTDKDSNNFVWFASKDVLDTGETYTLKATIKDHKEFKGIKQTVLTRCSIQ